MEGPGGGGVRSYCHSYFTAEEREAREPMYLAQDHTAPAAQPGFTPRPVKVPTLLHHSPVFQGPSARSHPALAPLGATLNLLLLFLVLALGSLLCFRLPEHWDSLIQGKVSKTTGCHKPTNLEPEI